MSTEHQPDQQPDQQPGNSLNYLLKHANQVVTATVDAALAPLGIDGRELGILVVIATPEPLSQQQVAQRLGIDRTTMVARIDDLEAAGLVTRSASPADRRRNVVALTPAGRTLFERALPARQAAEDALLDPLGARTAEGLRRSLAVLIGLEPGHPVTAGPDAG